jgi:predicted amidohydrolase
MSTLARRRACRPVATLLLLLAWPTLVEAHAIHTTLTVISASPAGMTLNIRAFADDFSAAVARYAARKPPADSSAPEIDVARYVRANFTVRDAQGRGVILEPCGVRRAAELYWLCFRAALPAGRAGVIVRNRMLTEYHADQVNIVQVDDRGARRTLLFTKTSAPSAIGGG